MLPAFVYPETKDDLEQLTTEIKKRANNVRNKLKSKGLREQPAPQPSHVWGPALLEQNASSRG